MGYVCRKHGKLSKEWCEDCNIYVYCDHSDERVSKIKNIIYDCDAGEKCVTIWIYHCGTCGKITYIES